jgi:ABC-type transport system substrate-binding protein
MLKSRWWAIAGVLALAMVVAACGGSDDDKDEGAAESGSLGAITGTATAVPQTTKPVKRGGTLIVAMDVNPKNGEFDPMKAGDTYTSAVTSAVTEGLMWIDEQIKPQCRLCERYEISSDGLTYTFHLRQGVKFHDGTEMDAQAVKFSVDRVRDEKNKQYPGFNDSKAIVDTRAVDKYTFQIVLNEVNSPFLTKLTGRLGGVVSPTAIQTMGDDKFGTAPVGTGPFKFKEFRNDQMVRVEKFEGYWRKAPDGQPLPYLDAVEWRIIPEPTTRLTALQTGDVHIAAIRDQDAKIVKEDKNLEYAQQAGFGLTTFSYNLSVPPFDNKALRQAVMFALDREEIIQAVYEGNRVVGNGFVPLTMKWAIDENFKPYPSKADPEKAKQKLAEGGKPAGFEFTAYFGSGSSQVQQLVELMAAQLAKVGIKMNIQLADFNGVVVPKWQKQEPDGHVYGISWSTGVDPDGLLTNVFTQGGSFNFSKYSNPRVTELVAAARKTSNFDERGSHYKEAMKLIMDDLPWPVIVYGIERHTASKKVQGWYLGTKATTSYSEYWLDQ